MNLHIHQLHLYEEHSESSKIWSASISFNTDGISLIMKSSPILEYASERVHVFRVADRDHIES